MVNLKDCATQQRLELMAIIIITPAQGATVVLNNGNDALVLDSALFRECTRTTAQHSQHPAAGSIRTLHLPQPRRPH